MGLTGELGFIILPFPAGHVLPWAPESLELGSLLLRRRAAGLRALSLSLVGTCSGIPPGAFQLLSRTVKVASHLPTDL